MAVQLSSAHKRAILDHEYPHITLSTEEAASVEPGERIVLKEHQVWIDVLGVGKDRRKSLFLRYQLRDDRPRYMRRNPHGMDVADIRSRMNEYGVPQRVSDQDAAEAVESSHYTGSPRQAVAGEAEEAVPPEYQNELTMRARRDRAETRDDEMFERQCKNFANEIRGIGRRAAKDGIDAGMMLAPLLREFERQIAKAREDDAA